MKFVLDTFIRYFFKYVFKFVYRFFQPVSTFFCTNSRIRMFHFFRLPTVHLSYTNTRFLEVHKGMIVGEYNNLIFFK